MGSITISDDLVKSAQAGDIDAENELFANLRARLLGLTKYILWRSYPQLDKFSRDLDADDIVQDTLVTIQDKYKGLDFETGFFIWANKVLRNTTGNYMMEKKRRDKWREVTESKSFFLYYQNCCSEDDYEYKELLEKIKLNLKKLNEDCQKIIMIFLREGCRDDVIALFPGVPIGTIDNKIYRCRKKYKALLLKDGYIS